jgi:hypothetical protein
LLTVPDAAKARNKKLFEDDDLTDEVFFEEAAEDEAVYGAYQVRLVETCLLRETVLLLKLGMPALITPHLLGVAVVWWGHWVWLCRLACDAFSPSCVQSVLQDTHTRCPNSTRCVPTLFCTALALFGLPFPSLHTPFAHVMRCAELCSGVIA